MKSHHDQRRLVKLAVAVHAALAAPSPAREIPQLPVWDWERCQRDLRRFQCAGQRHWHHAEAAVQSELRASLEGLGDEVQRLLTQLRPAATSAPLSACDIFRDLMALREEFCDVEWTFQQNTLAVTTAPIELEGRYLGPFRIELNTSQLLLQPSYCVVAVDPQPASQDSDVAHPHVQGDQLCEGEGTMPISAALREGRLLDFFLIINSLLHTYNDSSPYVSLAAWDGVRCSDCGYQMSDDDSRGCERCETDLCSDCVRCCRECSDSACSQCSSVCSECDEDVCRSCVKSCCDCDESFCPSCLQDDERCTSCHEDFQQEAESESATDLQPVRVGEVAILA